MSAAAADHALPDTAFDFTPGTRARVAALVSGRGSNMLALADAAGAPEAPFQLTLVLSDQAEAPGLAAAAARGIDTGAADGPDRAAREAILDARLRAAGVDLICLAGFMRVLSADFVAKWAGRILNIHPSLLPAFPGLDTHARAIAAGVRLHGATVHLATATLDEGPMLAQGAVAVAESDTPESLAARVLPVEHRLYPAALAAYASGRLRLAQGRIQGLRPIDGTFLALP